MWTLIQSTPCTCSQELAAESSETCCLDISLLAQSKSKHIPEKFCLQGNLTEAYLDSLFGMTCVPSEATTRTQARTSSGCAESRPTCVSAADSHARISVAQEKGRDLTASGRVYGVSLPVSLARYDPLTYSLRTRQCLLFEDSTELFVTLPRWGMTRHGECFRLPMLEHDTSAKGYGSWPTPSKSDGVHHGKEKWIQGSRNKFLSGQRAAPPTEKVTYAYYESGLNLGLWCQASEMLMMWLEGWTDLVPLATGSVRKWLSSHGRR